MHAGPKDRTNYDRALETILPLATSGHFFVFISLDASSMKQR